MKAWQDFKAWLDAANANDLSDQDQAIRNMLDYVATKEKIHPLRVNTAFTAICYAEHCVAEVMVEFDAFKKEHKLLGHKLICCHVAANHPDPMLSRTGVYIEKWDSQSAEAVRKVRDERDALKAEIAALKATHTWQPINTAPKDGKVVIALLPDGDVQKSWYFAPSSTTCGWMTGSGDWIEPIGWIPCPQNPQEQPK